MDLSARRLEKYASTPYFSKRLAFIIFSEAAGVTSVDGFFVQNTITDVLYSFVARIAKTIVTEVTDEILFQKTGGGKVYYVSQSCAGII